ncbi:hypothetical protein H0S70_01800 [Chryseobacterium manosquense]|uniref:Uncharacterized protein n=1 Tax=Chryseobacterium manosquense TaxID=2754694 RepID=A0A7H1DXP5_9FLAO|nr:hypothetical protein [Chryseobacterium manosquense]MBV2165378.1 hypothetical protein [Kaistella sp.]QIY83752.1 hypothetical protein HER18_09525 [Chryseobacterium sp. NEB161]QNS41753.1 hypothetical protein H0S70_01800 [Chryseobacterium manosquense]
MEFTITLEQLVNGFLYLLWGCYVLIFISMVQQNTEKSEQLVNCQQKNNVLQKLNQKLNQAYEEQRKESQSSKKICEELTRLDLVKNIETKAQEIISDMNQIDENLVKMQKQHEQLFEEQKKLHSSLLREHHLLNQYFQNYT